MASNTVLNLQQSPVADRLAGAWKLVPEHAVTLNPGQAGVLRVTQGRIWVTLDGPHQGPANDWGDIVLQCGQQITLLPGQHVVMEPYGDAVNQASYFSWEPAPVTPDRPVARAVGPVVWQPLAAAGRTLRQAWGALSWLVAGRGRVLSCWESNQP